jgi:hypothetical protein
VDLSAPSEDTSQETPAHSAPLQSPTAAAAVSTATIKSSAGPASISFISPGQAYARPAAVSSSTVYPASTLRPAPIAILTLA